MDHNLQKILEWAAEHEASFTIKNNNGLILVQGEIENITTEYPVTGSDHKNLGAAVHAALYAAAHGLQFHQQYGHFPPKGAGTGMNPELSDPELPPLEV